MWGPVKKCIQFGMVWSSSSRLIRPLQFGGLCRWVCVVIDGDSRKSQSCHFTIYVPLPITTQWPCDHGFPGVLLYARLLCLTCSATPLSHWPRYLFSGLHRAKDLFLYFFGPARGHPATNALSPRPFIDWIRQIGILFQKHNLFTLSYGPTQFVCCEEEWGDSVN